MVGTITPKTFFSVVRGRASLDDTNRVYEALAKPESELNRWLGVVEKYADLVYRDHESEGAHQGRRRGGSGGGNGRSR